MNKYTIEITEVLQKQICIDAENTEEAIKKVEELYQNQKIVLNEENYIETNFEVVEGI